MNIHKKRINRLIELYGKKGTAERLGITERYVDMLLKTYQPSTSLWYLIHYVLHDPDFNPGR